VWLCGSIRSCRQASPHNTTCKTNERMLPHNHTWRLKFQPVILTRIKKHPDDDHLMIETRWSDFKCFNVWRLNWCFIRNKCISWTITHSELKCTAKQWSSAPIWRICVKFDVWVFFRKSFDKIQVSLKCERYHGYFTCMVFRSFLFRMRCFRPKFYRKLKHTFYI
jgi:hypothetical protein